MTFHQVGMRQDLLSGSIGFELSTVQNEDSLAKLEHKVQIVCRHDLRSGELS